MTPGVTHRRCRWRQWLRFAPAATFTDPWVDACRALVVVDVQCWPAAVPQHAWKWGEQQEWMAPSLDLYVRFQNILGDVQITLDSVSEQKAMVDHVFAELARIEYLVQEARGTMRALQTERDVAQRIVENVRQIHARANGEERVTA